MDTSYTFHVRVQTRHRLDISIRGRTGVPNLSEGKPFGTFGKGNLVKGITWTTEGFKLPDYELRKHVAASGQTFEGIPCRKKMYYIAECTRCCESMFGGGMRWETSKRGVSAGYAYGVLKRDEIDATVGYYCDTTGTWTPPPPNLKSICKTGSEVQSYK